MNRREDEITLDKCAQLKKEIEALLKKSKTNSLTTLTGANLRYAKELMHVLSVAKKELKSKSAKEKFTTSIGIEYTFLIKNPEEYKSTEDNSAANDFLNRNSIETFYSNKLSKELDKRQRWNRKSHRDGDMVVECPSPIHYKWNDMLGHYRVVRKAAEKVGLVTHKEGEGGGGGHIHLGIPKNQTTSERLNFLAKIFMDMARRPYLNWIFNEPVDVLNANSMLTTLNGIKFIRFLNNQYSFDINTYSHMIGNTKDYGIRYCSDYDTVEFRIFDMPRDEQTLEEYVEFINAYYKFIDKESNYSVDLINLYNIKNNSYDIFKDKKHVIRQFNKLLKQLGLNPERYKKYIKLNYEARLDMEKEGLIKMDYDLLNALVIPEEKDGCDNESFEWTSNLRGTASATINANSTITVSSGETGEVDMEMEIDEESYEGEIAPVPVQANDSFPAFRGVYPIETSEDDDTIKYVIHPGQTMPIGSVPVTNNSADFMIVTQRNGTLSFSFKPVQHEVVAALQEATINQPESIPVYNLADAINIIEQ